MFNFILFLSFSVSLYLKRWRGWHTFPALIVNVGNSYIDPQNTDPVNLQTSPEPPGSAMGVPQ